MCCVRRKAGVCVCLELLERAYYFTKSVVGEANAPSLRIELVLECQGGRPTPADHVFLLFLCSGGLPGALGVRGKLQKINSTNKMDQSTARRERECRGRGTCAAPPLPDARRQPPPPPQRKTKSFSSKINQNNPSYGVARTRASRRAAPASAAAAAAAGPGPAAAQTCRRSTGARARSSPPSSRTCGRCNGAAPRQRACRRRGGAAPARCPPSLLFLVALVSVNRVKKNKHAQQPKSKPNKQHKNDAHTGSQRSGQHSSARGQYSGARWIV